MKIYSLFILAMLLGMAPLAQAVDICEPESFYGLRYKEMRFAIDDFVQATPESQVINRNFWSNFERPPYSQQVLGQSCNKEGGDTPLHLAINKAVESSSAVGINFSSLIHRPITIERALEGSELSLITALINKDAPLNVTNKNGETPLDMVKRMMRVEDFSDEKLDLYVFIYQESQNRLLTDEDQRNNIFQRICHSRYNYDKISAANTTTSYEDHPKIRTKTTTTVTITDIERLPRIKRPYYAEKLAYEAETQTVIDEYNQWLSFNFFPEVARLPMLMEIYKILHRSERLLLWHLLSHRPNAFSNSAPTRSVSEAYNRIITRSNENHLRCSWRTYE